MGRRNETDVNLVSPVAPEPLKLLLLQDSEEFSLQFQRNVADFVEKSVPLWASSKRPWSSA